MQEKGGVIKDHHDLMLTKNQNIKREMTELSQEQEIVQAENDQLLHDNQCLLSKLANHQSAIAQEGQKAKRIAASRDELLADVEKVKTSLAELHDHCRALQVERDTVHGDIDDLTQQSNSITEANGHLSKDNDRIKKEREQLRQQFGELLSQNTNFTKLNEELMNDLVNLQNQLAQAQASTRQLTDQELTHRNLVSEAKTAYEFEESRQNKIKENVAECKKLEENYQQRMENVRAEIELAQAEETNLLAREEKIMAKNAHLTQENDIIKARLAAMKQNQDYVETVSSELDNENGHISELLTHLEEKYNFSLDHVNRGVGARMAELENQLLITKHKLEITENESFDRKMALYRQEKLINLRFTLQRAMHRNYRAIFQYWREQAQVVVIPHANGHGNGFHGNGHEISTASLPALVPPTPDIYDDLTRGHPITQPIHAQIISAFTGAFTREQFMDARSRSQSVASAPNMERLRDDMENVVAYLTDGTFTDGESMLGGSTVNSRATSVERSVSTNRSCLSMERVVPDQVAQVTDQANAEGTFDLSDSAIDDVFKDDTEDFGLGEVEVESAPTEKFDLSDFDASGGEHDHDDDEGICASEEEGDAELEEENVELAKEAKQSMRLQDRFRAMLPIVGKQFIQATAATRSSYLPVIDENSNKTVYPFEDEDLKQKQQEIHREASDQTRASSHPRERQSNIYLHKPQAPETLCGQPTVQAVAGKVILRWSVSTEFVDHLDGHWTGEGRRNEAMFMVRQHTIDTDSTQEFQVVASRTDTALFSARVSPDMGSYSTYCITALKPNGLLDDWSELSEVYFRPVHDLPPKSHKGFMTFLQQVRFSHAQTFAHKHSKSNRK